ncbi:MAG: HDIG domain-containing protein [bacterium]|nr:HDIG domain-containing protein [bacterium]
MWLPRLGRTLTVAAFVLAGAVILALDELFPRAAPSEQLQVGMVAPADIRAPYSLTYVSAILTERRRAAAVAEISPIYEAPDPNVTRQQIALLTQILDFIDDVRADPFGTPTQKISDVEKITALNLDSETVRAVVTMDGETWGAARAEMALVLERMMRESIRENDLPQVIDQLPTQVSVRFDPTAASVVTAFVRDLLRPNRLPNAAATTAAREAAAASVLPESRSFERGQILLRGGTRIDDADFEALRQFDLLGSADRRLEVFLRALMACSITVAGFGLYLSRSANALKDQPNVLLLLGTLFLIVLLGARLFDGDSQQIYLYPAAGLALVLAGVIGVDVALLAAVGLGFLIGLLSDNSLEVAALVGGGSVIGALSLRRFDRLNSYFLAGVLVALSNLIIVLMFQLTASTGEGVFTPLLIVYGVMNGLLSGIVALAVLYLLTVAFNLPTTLKLSELSQPNQPLLQRLLREAPGTYQHSLQVANLSEQAANAIGADAGLVRVAALYHDIGKMLNPAFFVENQADNVNPHDLLNDPHRSADLIISHVTDGDKLARAYRLPQRIRDFICEHHGTTRVGYFYTQAVQRAGDEEPIEPDQFTYPGPRPRSRETAILMLADSCESSVRAAKPTRKAEIESIVGRIFESRMQESQLDDSGLTLHDLATIRTILIDMLQAVFHPRIQYPSLLTPASTAETVEMRSLRVGADSLPAGEPMSGGENVKEPETRRDAGGQIIPNLVSPAPPKQENRYSISQELPAAILDDDDSPMPDVPPLRRRTDESEPKTSAEKDDHA